MTKTQTRSKARPHGPAGRIQIQVKLSELGLAPENLRFDEPEDDEVPRLAETIHAAGVIYPPLVRKGRKGEQPYMVLDGRRRRFALLRLAADGKIAEDFAVDCLLAQDRAGQAAAAVLPNTEVSPVHPADVIAAIGKLRAAKLGTRAIADALGYHELEVKKLEAVAGVHPDALAAFKRGRINLRQVRMFTRIRDMKRQGELASMALSGLFNEHLVHSAGVSGRVTQSDPRFGIITTDDYAKGGGRMAVDLFGELPPEVLDVEVLDELWRTRAALLAAPVSDAGVELSFGPSRGYQPPEGLENLPFVHWGALSTERREAYDAVRARYDAAVDAITSAEGEAFEQAYGELLLADLEEAKLTAGRGEIVAGLVTPTEDGVTITFFQRPAEPESALEADADDDEDGVDGEGPDEDDDEDEEVHPGNPVNGVVVQLSGVTHQQHAARTEIATQGLMRDLADKPEAAMIVLTAHLFGQLVLYSGGLGQGVLQVSAHPGVRGDGPEDGLAGEVWGRLEVQRQAYQASQQRPIAYVAAMAPADRLDLLAALVAASVDLRELRTDQVRRAARAEAVEVAALCEADLARRWTPDTGFLQLHSTGQLEGWLKEMGAELPHDAKRKADVVRVTEAAAAERRWIPDVLRWPRMEQATETEPDAELKMVTEPPEGEVVHDDAQVAAEAA